jgi:phosphoribosylglycinamide formyltransferase-1
VAKLKLGVLISGRGSNLQALIRAAEDPAYPAQIVLAISNRRDAPGLALAQAAGIATRIIPHGDYADRAAFDRALDDALRDAGVELVCLAGFMRLLSDWFALRWRDRLINIHPSLLPAFKGLRAHEEAIAAGVRFSGCTVHFVRPDMDAGPIIVQAVAPVLADDTAESLAARILQAEHRCYALAVRMIAEGRVSVVGERAIVAGAHCDPAASINPCA